MTRVVPMSKSGDRALFSNYRPISVLPCFAKFLERIVTDLIINYLKYFHVLCENQYGFRKNRSKISTALNTLCLGMRLLIIFLLDFFLFSLLDLRDKDEVASALRTALGSTKVCCGYSSDIVRI